VVWVPGGGEDHGAGQLSPDDERYGDHAPDAQGPEGGDLLFVETEGSRDVRRETRQKDRLAFSHGVRDEPGRIEIGWTSSLKFFQRQAVELTGE
jgi:hypothetical protein